MFAQCKYIFIVITFAILGCSDDLYSKDSRLKTSMAPKISLPKFSARCFTGQNVFLLVSIPDKNEMYFAREDGRYNSSRFINIQVFEDKFTGNRVHAYNGFKDDNKPIIFMRKTGELFEIYYELDYTSAPFRYRERYILRNCQPLPIDSYEAVLSQVSSHIERELLVFKQKEHLKATLEAEKERERERARNAPNKF